MNPIENKLTKIQEDIEVIESLLKIRGRADRNTYLMQIHILQAREARTIRLIEEQNGWKTTSCSTSESATGLNGWRES